MKCLVKIKIDGLVVNFLGDSITEGTGVINISENRYDNFNDDDRDFIARALGDFFTKL